MYDCGDQEDTIYFIESGQIKLVMLSSEGRECILAIHSAGDIFGGLCLSGLRVRLETATAMKQTTLKQISSAQLFARLSRDALLEGFNESGSSHRQPCTSDSSKAWLRYQRKIIPR